VADLLVSGIIYGSIITLAAIGLTLMSDILKFFNFAYPKFTKTCRIRPICGC
jgi:branched-subunit amino acid ABC-type transport system permease component